MTSSIELDEVYGSLFHENSILIKCESEPFELITNLNDWCYEDENESIDWEERVTSSIFLHKSKCSDNISQSEREVSKVELFEEKELVIEQKFNLQTVTALACCITLEDLIDKLSILGQLLNLPKPAKDLKYKTFEERFDTNDMNEEDFLLTKENEDYEIALQKHAFQKHRTYFELMLKELHDELIRFNTYQSIVDHVTQTEKILYDEAKLIKNENKNKLYLRNLLFTLQYEKTLGEYNLLIAAEETNLITGGFEDEKLTNKINMRYLEEWENARAEQNQLRLSKKDENLKETIEMLDKELERESRVHGEISRALRTFSQMLSRDLEEWIEKYSHDMDNKEIDITMLKELRDSQFEKLKQLQEDYLNHRNEMEEYIIGREKRLKETIRNGRRHMAAWKIQHWWRKCRMHVKRKFRKPGKVVKKLKKNLKEKLHQ